WIGWGIRLAWDHGPISVYNVSGLEAVELRMKGGGRFRIGTDEPRELCAAIHDRIMERKRAAAPSDAGEGSPEL
ncbi:MAG TPA: hypothetical protein VFU47_03600, partial [Armatimonadota bacterium]|nr:hypothetical protein [Armatimonadota bacterium]